MKYTHGAEHRQGSHLTDLIGDGPMFCYVLLIVFTLFFFCSYWAPSTPFLWDQWLGCWIKFFVSIGLPVPRFSGPDGQGVAIWVLSNTTITIQFFSGNILTNNVTSIQFFFRKWSTMLHQWYSLTNLRPQYNTNGILSVNWTQKWGISINYVIFSSGVA